ncbi:oxygenase MpaB family protein [Rhodococcus sp. B50]|uniref:oxygenase MpaB family protein n=1 Tax=Rhodococcus sp. B50 TaxID=2682847 RepID=UPI0027DAF1B2|nr:oxygenase MpaB family protein [Rhodococcus sp. B50]MBS9372100.1 hypothetical protein [Rhodococcus sp. B50]
MSKTNRTLGMNPETHFREIYRTLSTYEFPWDINQALSFALFRTYAVPSVGKLLYETGQFTEDTQKRYDDTSLLLEVPLLHGFDSEEGKSAIRRINQMHRMYDITNDDFLYVLSTFVVVPQRWIRDYGWRQLTDDELLASVRYYQTLGRHMGIKNIPETFEGFETLMDDYEHEHFAYDAGARAVADSTMDLLASFYPRPAKRIVNLFSRTLMDEPLLDAFRYKHPHPLARKASLAAMKARAFAVSKMPARRKPKHVYEMSRIRSYPNGFDIRAMGTFAPGCPVDHSSPTADSVG